MRIGTSRADRIGFTVFVVLASLLAVLLVRNLGNDSTESAQEVATFADFAPVTAVPTTDVVSMPAPTATPTPDPTPLPIEPAAAPEDDEADEVEDETDADADADDTSTADGAEADQGTTATASAGTSESANAAPAPAVASDSTDGAVPNPQAPATAVPNPQAPATAVPNPQPATTTVPNPQPATQPVVAAAAPVNAPADAPAGGTFTHTLTATVSLPSLHTSAGGATFMPSFNGVALPPVNPTVFGNPLVYRVLAGAPGDAWAKVYVPARPNGTTAWVQTSQFNWGSSNQLLQINVSNNTVTLFEGSNVLISTAAVTGKSSSPTPLANAWVEEIMAGPSSAYGPRLISLGIFSDALNSFGSRNAVPKIALHGTNNPSLMGQYASNGCIRVPNDVITQIAARVKVGSKVIIIG